MKLQGLYFCIPFKNILSIYYFLLSFFMTSSYWNQIVLQRTRMFFSFWTKSRKEISEWCERHTMSIRFAADRQVLWSGSRVPVGFYQEARGGFTLLFFLLGKFHTAWKSRQRKLSTYIPPSALSKPRVDRPFLFVTSTLLPFQRAEARRGISKCWISYLLYLLHTLPSISSLHACPYSGHLHPYRWKWEELSAYGEFPVSETRFKSPTKTLLYKKCGNLTHWENSVLYGWNNKMIGCCRHEQFLCPQ